MKGTGKIKSMGKKEIKVIAPVLPDEAETRADVKEVLEVAERLDERVSGILFQDGTVEEGAFPHLVVSGGRFWNCRFWNCSFEKSEFVDVRFQSCDFSGCNMEDTYFNRVEFDSCKGVGTKFLGSILKHVAVKDCNLNYANFDASRLENISIENTELNGSNLTQCKCKDVKWCKAGLTNASFFKTSMRGMDFTDSVIQGIVLSDDCRELKGAVVDLYQAAELAKRLGVVIK